MCPRRQAPGGGAEFDAARAFTLLEAQCAAGSRAPGTAGHRAVRRLIVRHLLASADEVALQTWRQRVARGPGAGRTFLLTNVLARFHGTAAPAGGGAPGPADFMFSTHWDTRPVADADPDPARRHLPVPGASDGASGVAVLLELARTLAVAPPARPTILAFWDGEDFGEYYYGSRLFGRLVARGAYAAWRARRGVVVDMMWGASLRCVSEQFSMREAAAVWGELLACADQLGLGAHFGGPPYRVNDDHVFLTRAGIPTALLIDYTYPYRHTTGDLPERCRPESLGVIGAVLRRLLAVAAPGPGA